MSSIYAVDPLVRLCIVQWCSLKWWKTSASVTNTVNQAISCKSQTYVPSLLHLPCLSLTQSASWSFLNPAFVGLCFSLWDGPHSRWHWGHICCRMCAHHVIEVCCWLSKVVTPLPSSNTLGPLISGGKFLLCLSVSLLKVYLNSLAVTIAYLSNGIELSIGRIALMSTIAIKGFTEDSCLCI